MTPAEADERALDLLSSCLGNVALVLAAVTTNQKVRGDSDLADRMLDQLSGSDARLVLGSLTAVASVLLTAVAAHTTNPPEDILAAMRRSMAP